MEEDEEDEEEEQEEKKSGLEELRKVHTNG